LAFTVVFNHAILAILPHFQEINHLWQNSSW
jgi:hypothetical protein